jgi:hypothetical protein
MNTKTPTQQILDTINEMTEGELVELNNDYYVGALSSTELELYQNINLLFIDELIDNGLDAAGVEGALGVLKKMARERNKNIYLISHKDELIGRVNNVLKVVKENGFTSYANDLEIQE